jgi:hypothetical protein
MVLYFCALIVFSLHQKSLKLILVDEPLPKGILSHLEITKFPLKTSKAHIFLSRALFPLILVPKFSEFITLSILAFIHINCLLCWIYLSLVCFALVNSYRSHCSKISRSKSLKNSRFSLAGNKASVHVHSVPIIFLSTL